MATVSVVIPTYDRPEYLDGAVDSALKQTYDEVEIIVVNDGSPTDYASELTDSHGEHVRCVVHDENRGLSTARNTGIEAAKGSYVAFLDDDDRWEPTKIERQMKELETTDGAAIATCLLASIKSDGTLVQCDNGMPSGDLRDEILRSNAIGTPSRVLVQASALETVGAFDESLSTKQDWDLYIRLCQDWKVICVDDHLCYRTIHDNMSNDPEVMETDLRAVIDKHESLLRERDVYREALASYFETVGFWYLEADRSGEARRCLSRSLSAYPQLRPLALYLASYLQWDGTNPVVELKRALSRRRNCANVNVPVSLRNN
jgi:glycosyltransferase involved in cell wall biosynthesis